MADLPLIVIAGSGPAGTAAALGLQQIGYEVVVITSPRNFVACEGISERVWQGLYNAGIRHALKTIAAPSPRLASWNGISSEANTERLIRRDTFDQALILDLEEARIRVICGRITQTQFEGDSVHISATTAAGENISLTASFFVDARGRSAPGRAQARIRGPETVSLLQRWQGEPVAGQSAAVSFPDGWAWMARFSDGSRYTQLTLSADNIPSRPQLAEFFFPRLQQIEEARPFFEGASVAGDIHARSATAILTCDPIEDRMIRIGDAALAVDPLSGNGIFQSLSTALLAPKIINTVLYKAGSAALAQQFYRERVNHAFMRFARMGRDFYQQEKRWPEQSFWQQRQCWPDQVPMHEPVAPDEVTIARRAVVSGDFISDAEVVITPDQPLGIWHLQGVALAPLVRELQSLQRQSTAPETKEEAAKLIEKLLRQHDRHVNPEHIPAVLSWLYQQGLIGR